MTVLMDHQTTLDSLSHSNLFVISLSEFLTFINVRFERMESNRTDNRWRRALTEGSSSG